MYDNDYLPHQDRIGWQDPWTVESGTGWKGPQGGGLPQRTFQFDNSNGASAIYFDSRVNHPSIHSLIGSPTTREAAALRQRFEAFMRLSPTAGQGPLELQLTKRDDCFTADFLPGKVQLRRTKLLDSEPLKLGQRDLDRHQRKRPSLIWMRRADLPKSSSPMWIMSCQCGSTVAWCSQLPMRITCPDVKTLYQEAIDSRFGSPSKPIVRVNAADQASSVEHLRLARDVYYINRGNHYTAEAPPRNPNSNESYWGSPENIMNLGPDEYFVLGDNSQVSLDARFWAHR